MPAPIHVLGAGAIGTLFAAELARAGAEVRLLVRSETDIEQLRQRSGLSIERDGVAETIAVTALTPPRIDTGISTLLVCTKAQQTAAAIDGIARHLTPASDLVLLQNGMGVREELCASYPHLRWLQGLITEGAFLRDRFDVVHAARGETVIGGFEQREQQRAEQLAAHWPAPTLTLRAVPDIRRRQWLKLAANCVINPLTALHRCRNGELLNLPGIAATVATLCDEITAVAAADGVQLDSDELQRHAFAVMRGTAANRSSMLRDIEQGRDSEIDYLNGHVVRRGQHHGIDCPAQRDLWQRVRTLTAQR